MAEAVEEFQDFTVATHWERFVASLEQIFRSWASVGNTLHNSNSNQLASADGPAQTRVVSHQLPFRSEPYTLSYFTDKQQTSGQSDKQTDRRHSGRGSGLAVHYSEERKLQQWFDACTYVTLEPNSYSRRILNDQEASTLLSALAAALSNCHLAWPAFLPVHDPLRDAYWGIGAAGLATAHYDSDSIHLSKNPSHLQQVDGQLQFFAQQLMPHSQAASQACLAAASLQQPSTAVTNGAGPAYHVTLSMLRSYKLPTTVAEHEEEDEMARSDDPLALWPDDWAAGAPWHSFASHGDPVGFVELDMLWSEVPAEQVMQEGGFLLSGACSWRLHALAPASSHVSQSFYTSKAKVKRGHLKLASQPCMPLSQSSVQFQHSWEAGSAEPDTFTSMLSNLVHSRRMATSARSVGDLASQDWWDRQGLVPPEASPPHNLQRVLADVFQEGQQGDQAGPTGTLGYTPTPRLHFPKTAPPESLLVRLALHVMCFSNARAIASLWQRFVRYLREACWDRGHLLPRMTPPSNPPSHHHTRQHRSDASAPVEPHAVGLPRPDFNCCLLHQKLQMLNLCIQQAHGTQAGQPIGPHSQQVGAGPAQDLPEDMQADEGWDSADMEEYQEASSEVDGIPPPLHLLADPTVPISIPQTQEAPAMTEDMLMERQAALAALDQSEMEQAARARLQGGGLLQADMAAFKAANPACQLADFVRWHSPKDWHPDPTQPQGGVLSDRMSHEDNVWQQLWQSTAAKAASAQEPLMNAEKEAERVFHDLEQVPPSALWDQLLALAAVAAAAMLAACPGATLLPARQQLLLFQQESSSILEEAGSTWLTNELPGRASGSPRARPRQPQSPLAANNSEEDEQEASLAGLQEHQAAALVQSLQKLEQVVIAGESLCRRLPGCPDAASKLLQAAMHPQELPVSSPGVNVRHAAQENGDAHSDEVSYSMANPTPERQQDEESLDMQAGVQVNNEQEKLVVNALMRYQPTDSAQSRPSSLQQCGECAAWGDGLCSQWVTHCFYSRPAGTLPCHRLYVQAASGEMRLATVMVSEG